MRLSDLDHAAKTQCQMVYAPRLSVPLGCHGKGTAMYLRLTYASIIVDSIDGRQEFCDITDHAEIRNRELSIGGVLSFDGLQFLQILEGDRKSVEALYGRIGADPRHHGVVCLRTTLTDVRHFDYWGMRRQPAIEMLMLSQHLA